MTTEPRDVDDDGARITRAIRTSGAAGLGLAEVDGVATSRFS